MTTIFKHNNVNAIVFKLQLILLFTEGTEKSEGSFFHLAMEIDAQVTHHVLAMDLTKCSNCNSFQVIRDLVHDFMNFNALKIINKFIKKLEIGRPVDSRCE